MSVITDFYLGHSTDDAGRTIEDVWSFKEGWMEMCHDYIQTIFPLPEPSNFHEDAPLLSEEDMKAFRNSQELNKRLQMSAEKLLWFLGLRWTGAIIEEDAHFERRKPILENFNHNHLRITRMLRCLTLCGQENIAKATLAFLKNRGYGSVSSMGYWERACNGNP